MNTNICRPLALLTLLSLAAPLAAQFENVFSTNEQLKQDAAAAPLAMQFDGKTPEELRAWQTGFGVTLRKLLGPHQPPKQWKTIVEGREELDGYTRERLTLMAEGHPPLPVFRLLPRPLPEKPCAGVVAIHGHSGVYGVVGHDDLPGVDKLIEEANYDYGRKLAKRGYIVVAPVLTPFAPREDRSTYGKQDPCAVTFVRMQLLGKVLIAENLRDCLWSVELLAQDKRVDEERLGCIGLSYGGRMTMLTAALEPRIRVAAISGACNVMQERIEGRYSCGAQVIPGLLKYGDVPEIGSLIAPRPCVWEIGSRDGLIDPAWADAALTRIRRAYTAAGAADQLHVDRFEGGHRWSGKLAEPLLDEVLK